MTERRVVRATTQFFDDLDANLDHERGLNGEPSVNDFLQFELFKIIEEFAVGWERLPRMFPERGDYRMLVGSGRVVAGYLVVGQLGLDGAIELVQLDIDPTGWA